MLDVSKVQNLRFRTRRSGFLFTGLWLGNVGTRREGPKMRDIYIYIYIYRERARDRALGATD